MITKLLLALSLFTNVAAQLNVCDTSTVDNALKNSGVVPNNTPGSWAMNTLILGQGALSSNPSLNSLVASKCGPASFHSLYSKATNPMSYAVVHCNLGVASISLAVCSNASPSYCNFGTTLSLDPVVTPSCKPLGATLPSSVLNTAPGSWSRVANNKLETCDATSMEFKAKVALAPYLVSGDVIHSVYSQVVSGMKYTVAFCNKNTPIVFNVYSPFSGSAVVRQTSAPYTCIRPAVPDALMTGAPSPLKDLGSVPKVVLDAALAKVISGVPASIQSNLYAATVQSTFPPKYSLYFCDITTGVGYKYVMVGTSMTLYSTAAVSKVSVTAQGFAAMEAQEGDEQFSVEDEANNTPLIIGGVAGSVLVLVAAIAGVIIIRKKLNARKNTTFADPSSEQQL